MLALVCRAMKHLGLRYRQRHVHPEPRADAPSRPPRAPAGSSTGAPRNRRAAGAACLHGHGRRRGALQPRSPPPSALPQRPHLLCPARAHPTGSRGELRPRRVPLRASAESLHRSPPHL
eukprot:scaffold31528_cov28-Tisochrysis_lutea.AAC.2